MEETTALHQTPLFDEHVALGAKMVGFGGWHMPLQYEGILAEWQDNRRGCSVFDCSHMGEFLVQGDAFSSGLDRLVTQPIVDMPVKSCRYGTLLQEDGTTVDDLIVYRKSQEMWMLVVNAANIEKDAARIKAHLRSNASFEDISFQTAKLDLQGPLSRDVLKTLVPGVAALEYYTFDEFDLLGERCLISRTGYTGELGYEIYYPWEKVTHLWKVLLGIKPVKPTGLGVRDVLRIEMAYPLYGHELSESITPLEAGLGKFIDWNKEFFGKEALLAQKTKGVARTLACIKSESRKSPRAGGKVFTAEYTVIGEIVSGTFSPGLNAGIGLAFVQKDKNLLEKTILFGDDKNMANGMIVKRPFLNNTSLKH